MSAITWARSARESTTTAGRTAGAPAPSTRERILDIALELFVDQGYDKTSLRDIAERLGTTKAALYYHFERKQDILLELHLRLHALGREALEQLEELEDAARSVRVLADYLERHPDALLRGKPGEAK